jgi:hypothetical protein
MSVKFGYNPGLITKVLTIILQIISLSVLYILGRSMCLSTYPLPLCINGISSLGILLAFEQCPVTFSANWDHWKDHTSISVF